MSIKEIVKLGHPALKRKSEEVTEFNAETRQLIQDLKDTLYSTTGIGLAAPQIAVNKRVILVDLRNGMEPLILVNPVIKRRLGRQESEEGCLSYPGYYGYVERPKLIIVKGLDENGVEVKIRATELLGIALCHEIDHLNGVMFVDRATEVYAEAEAEAEAEE